MNLPGLSKFHLRSVFRGNIFIKRYDVINYFARKNSAQNYLEIGVNKGRCLERVIIEHKVGVDPNPKISNKELDIRPVTSDEFFASNSSNFDIVFIDGLHFAEQVLRDIRNSLAALNPGGVILLHDCNPLTQFAASRNVPVNEDRHWNGDTWKAFAFFHKTFPAVFSRVLDLDQGIGVILSGHNPASFIDTLDLEIANSSAEWFDKHDWIDLSRNRATLLGLISNRLELERDMMLAGF